MRRKLAAGNWKMNGIGIDLEQIDRLMELHPNPTVDLMICPPATLIHPMAAKTSDHPIHIGGQDCHTIEKGAHTGDISAVMLDDAGARAVILGHSERRADHGETDALVAAKSVAALEVGLTAVICIGETLDERESGKTLDVVGEQLAGSTPDIANGGNTVIAYEPVWAIGTGKIPTLEQIAEVHDFIRSELEKRFGEDGKAFRVLYGGSVKPSNAAEIFAIDNVDGALVGGASLKAEDFSGIITALENA